ncbi:MAG: alpha/beta hydrolase [Candidatus Omnitrophica bacterium]|nr:alpha/beta hydrolase [Candidatus Omnitrophota bacterium]
MKRTIHCVLDRLSGISPFIANRCVGLLLVACALLTGCGQTLMPTPAIYRQGGLDPFVSVRPEDRTNLVPVYYVTDREPAKTTDIRQYYSGRRSPDLRVGQARVRIGSPDLSWEELERESRLEKRDRNPKITLADVIEYGPLWTREYNRDPNRPVELPESANRSPGGQRFLAELNQRLSKFDEKNIYIYIHGYKNSFNSSVTLGAQLHHYLGRDGVFINYAWPSRDKLALYSVDKGNSMFSVRNFRLLLEYLAERTEADHIHIIAHSAGTGVPVAAFAEMSLLDFEKSAQEIQRNRKIGNVVLAAPDIDLEIYINASLDGSNRVPKRMTLYASREDRALKLSGWLFSMVRLGNPFKMIGPKELTALRKSKDRVVVDVTPAQSQYEKFLGHSYFHDNPWVSSDLFLFLKTGLEAPDRCLSPIEDGAMWTFAEDYPSRVQRIRLPAAKEDFAEPASRTIRPLPPVQPRGPLEEIDVEGGSVGGFR